MNWPITGRLPFFVKRDFDLKFISRVHVNMANVASGFDLVSQKFCIQELNAVQKEAIIQFMEKQRDVFINLPTGFGKSLIYQALPLVFDAMRGEGHIAVVISPLVSLMKDQVQKLKILGSLPSPSVTSRRKTQRQLRKVSSHSFMKVQRLS